jgi:hypothetical protein
MARYSIWVDSKSQYRRDPLGVLEALLWRSNSSFALSEHGARSSLYDEAKAIVKKHKATPEEVEVQLNQYRQDGIPDEKRFNGKKGLFLASTCIPVFFLEFYHISFIFHCSVLHFWSAVTFLILLLFLVYISALFLSWPDEKNDSLPSIIPLLMLSPLCG